MASGWGYIPVTNVSLSGAAWIGTTPPFEWNQFLAPSTSDTQQGEARITFDPNGQYELFGDVSGVFDFASLPDGFQITSIKRIADTLLSFAQFNAAGQSCLYPAFLSVGSGQSLGNTVGATAWETDFGWNDASQPMNDTVRAALQAAFILTVDVIIITGPTVGDDFTSTNGNSNQDTIDQLALPYPANVLVFEWDTDGGGDEPNLPPVTNPELVSPSPNPVIEVTVPPGTTEVIIQVPGEVDLIVPVVPGQNQITVPYPNPTSITIIPTGPGFGPGPGITIPMSVEYVMDGGLAFGGDAPMQFIGDPSGLYTLVYGQKFDKLIERIPTPDTTIEVKIPKPFIKTAFFGE